MDVVHQGQKFCRLVVPLPGLHNAYNSLAATGLLYHAGLDADRIAELLPRFTGTLRRMTVKAQLQGVTVVDDYAHHPRELQVTLRAIRDYFMPNRLLCVFQPHQHSRTRFLLDDFARSFLHADVVIVPDIYFVRDSEADRRAVNASMLVERIKLNGREALYIAEFPAIVEHLLTTSRRGDLVVSMGAGPVWEVTHELVRRLRRDC